MSDWVDDEDEREPEWEEEPADFSVCCLDCNGNTCDWCGWCHSCSWSEVLVYGCQYQNPVSDRRLRVSEGL